MFHALPTKPAFLGPPPATTTLSVLPPPSSTPSSSRLEEPSSNSTIEPNLPSSHSTPQVPPQDPTKCALCSSPPKYTCPRCALRTCSLPCLTTHKEKYSCSGIRRAEGYVSLREYGQGEWAEDYRYLEEGRRKVEGWGVGIKEEDLDGQPRGMGNQSGRGAPGASASGRGGAGGRGGGMAGRARKSKTHNLQMELRGRGIWTEYMPEGMGRRRLNQSGWNKQTGILALTVQLSIPRNLLPEEDAPAKATNPTAAASADESDLTAVSSSSSAPALASSSARPAPPNPASSTSSTDPRLIYHPRVLLAHPKTTPLPTLRSLLPPALASSKGITLLLPFFPSPARPAPSSRETPSRPMRHFFPPLSLDLPLVEVLKGAAWVEFPIIHIMPKAEWDAGVKEGRYSVVPLAQPRKRGAEEMDEPVGPAGKRWGVEQDSGWGKRGGKVAPQTQAVPAGAKKARVAVPAATEALGALGAYASDDEEDDDEGEGEYMGMRPSELKMEIEDEEGDEGGGTMEDGVVDDGDEVVFGDQPGGIDGLMAGLPPDLLVAMSHAIDADLS